MYLGRLVSETGATAPRGRPLHRRVLDFVEKQPEAVGIAVYAALAILLCFAAYVLIFTIFQPYDDEGTVLIALKAFVSGETLYRHIYSSYGPFYYEVFGGFFGLTGQAVTTDAGRTIVIVVWVASSLLFGLVCQRLTRSLMLGVSGAIVAFLSVGILTNEPMHPQGLCVLLIGALVLLAVSEWGVRALGFGLACGALLGALVLTKVNLGVFAIAALGLAAVFTLDPPRRRDWLIRLAAGLFLLMPVAIMARDLNFDFIRSTLTIQVLAMAAFLVVAWPTRAHAGEATLRRWLWGALGGFLAACVAILVAIFLTGPSPADVFEGVVVDAQRTRDILLTALPIPGGGVAWGVAAVAGAALVVLLRPAEPRRPTLWPALLRIAAAAGIWLAAARISPLAPSVVRNPDTLPMVLCWVAAIAPPGLAESAQRRFVRVFLPALALAEAIQVYPVAGSQMGIAAIVFVPVGALCIADAMHCLRVWSEDRGGEAPRKLGLVSAVAGAAVAAALALNFIALPSLSSLVTYRHTPSLALPGADLVHLPQNQVEEYDGLVSLIEANRCTALIGYPNFGSLYLWSGLQAPRPQVPDAWMKAFDSAEQQEVVDQVSSSPRPCGVRNEGLAANWLGGEPAPPRPLVEYIFDDLRPVAKLGDFEFLLPNGTPPKLVR